jgi:hypothetical protein
MSRNPRNPPLPMTISKARCRSPLLGQDVRILKDFTGKAFGEEHYKAAQKPEGQITEVSYLFPRVGADTTPITNRPGHLRP